MHLQQIMDYAVPNYRCLAPNLGTPVKLFLAQAIEMKAHFHMFGDPRGAK
jgi:hypothetical protein